MSGAESRMEARLWMRLPDELVERVLSFLPVPDLCRFRAVCKRWDSLISTPKFRTLSLENAGKGVGYIVARVVENSETHPKFHGWSILDLDAQRWYRIKYDQTLKGAEQDDHVYGFVAADGGLVCEFVSWNFCEPVVCIFDPLMRRRIMRLPDTPDHCCADSAFGMLNIVADGVDGSFKVFVINQGFNDSGCDYGDSEDPEKRLSHSVMPIYDSTTGQWRSSTNPPLQLDLGVSQRCSSVMFQGLLYVLFTSYEDGEDGHTSYSLCRYDIGEGSWEDTGVHIQFMMICFEPQLVVSDDRLFLLSWMDGSDNLDLSDSPSFYVCEILLSDRAHSVVFEMASELGRLVFHTEDTDDVPKNVNRRWRPDSIQVFGFGKSLILMSRITGITKVYNLVYSSLDRLPTNPMEPLPDGCELWYGKTMNLRLPSSTRKKKCTSAPGVNAEAAPSQII